MSVVPAKLPKVSYVRLGGSGLKISKIILGCMSYGRKTWADWVLEEEESMAHFEAAWKMGINSWDTADVYSNGESEILVGKAMRRLQIPRSELVIMTKAYITVAKDPNMHPSALSDPDGMGYVNQHGLSRKYLLSAIDASLARLGTDYVDLFQCHRFDPETPISETMEALHSIVQSGKARYIGMSSCYAYQFHEMQAYAEKHHLTKFISMQDFYCCVYREEEREMFPTLDLFKVGAITWSPLGRGYLTRPHSEQSNNSNRASSDPNYAKFVGLGNPAEEKMLQSINEAIESVANARTPKLSMAQVALAWQFANSTVSAPIVGSTNLNSLIELAEASHIVLTKEEVDLINAPYKPRSILGHA